MGGAGGRERPAEQEALGLVAVEALELVVLARVLDPRGDGLEPEGGGQITVVLRGLIGATVDDDEVRLEDGAVFLMPRGRRHSLWNAGDAPARPLEHCTPGGFEHVFADAGRRSSLPPGRSREPLIPGGRRSGLQQAVSMIGSTTKILMSRAGDAQHRPTGMRSRDDSTGSGVSWRPASFLVS